MGRTTNKQRRAESQQTARERAAAMRVEQQRRERRRRMTMIGGVTLGLLAIVGVIIGVSLGSSGGNSSTGGRTKLSAAAQQALTNVSDTAFNSVGAASGSVASPPQKTPPGTPPLTSNGHPEVLFIGAEFCPYCAADRWPLTVALNRFGTVTGLDAMHSSSTDVYPNTPTVSYLNVKYTSDHLSLRSIENENVAGKQLQKVDPADQKLWTKYTYNCQNGTCGPGFPLIDIGGKAVVIGPMYNPDILKGLTQTQIAKDLSNPSSPVTKAILGSANYMTAAMCMATQDKPANVCTPQITKLADSFPTWKPSTSNGSSANSSGNSGG